MKGGHSNISNFSRDIRMAASNGYRTRKCGPLKGDMKRDIFFMERDLYLWKEGIQISLEIIEWPLATAIALANVAHLKEDCAPKNTPERKRTPSTRGVGYEFYAVAMFGSMLQCVAKCCSVLQSGSLRCSAVQYVTMRCRALQCVAVCCSVLQCAAVRCILLHCSAVYCSVLQCLTVCCNTLQYVAVCCSMLQCGAVCRSVQL